MISKENLEKFKARGEASRTTETIVGIVLILAGVWGMLRPFGLIDEPVAEWLLALVFAFGGMLLSKSIMLELLHNIGEFIPFVGKK